MYKLLNRFDFYSLNNIKLHFKTYIYLPSPNSFKIMGQIETQQK